ncbi:hypothetical protein PVK06_002693 [Gossypium arboreum]|uniref:Uncharacterized protein n=1 Tax=Gossypium arboreum TaxID=29729 RepID=A0ABR0R5E1_GOSAR|nr:hypothetical protein PVK06_002693 [Gossypium arboreum]
MENESDNKVEQEFYSSDEHSDDCEETELVTPNVNSTGAQQPNVERDNNDEGGDHIYLELSLMHFSRL